MSEKRWKKVGKDIDTLWLTDIFKIDTFFCHSGSFEKEKWLLKSINCMINDDGTMETDIKNNWLDRCDNIQKQNYWVNLQLIFRIFWIYRELFKVSDQNFHRCLTFGQMIYQERIKNKNQLYRFLNYVFTKVKTSEWNGLGFLYFVPLL